MTERGIIFGDVSIPAILQMKLEFAAKEEVELKAGLKGQVTLDVAREKLK